jgi:heptaprenyl diphosphate synthase
MRIGLANLPLLLALDLFPLKTFALLVLIKISGQALITGALFSYVFLFSLAGTSASAALMYGLRRSLGPSRIGFTGIGVAGAMASNGVQLVLARFFVFGAGVQFLAPPFLASGLITGFALGLFCEAFCAGSRWYRLRLKTPEAPVHGRTLRARSWEKPSKSNELFIAGLLMMLIFLLNPSTVLRIPQFLFFCLLARLGGKKNNPLITIFIILGIVFFNLLVPYGKVLAEWGPLQITQGAGLSGIRKALTLEGLIMLSNACIRPDLHLPGRFGALLGESFVMLERIRERKIQFHRGRLIEGIDELMLDLDREVSAEAEEGQTAAGESMEKVEPGQNGHFTSRILLCLAVLLTAALTIAGFVIPISFF